MLNAGYTLKKLKKYYALSLILISISIVLGLHLTRYLSARYVRKDFNFKMEGGEVKTFKISFNGTVAHKIKYHIKCYSKQPINVDIAFLDVNGRAFYLVELNSSREGKLDKTEERLLFYDLASIEVKIRSNTPNTVTGYITVSYRRKVNYLYLLVLTIFEVGFSMVGLALLAYCVYTHIIIIASGRRKQY